MTRVSLRLGCAILAFLGMTEAGRAEPVTAPTGTGSGLGLGVAPVILGFPPGAKTTSTTISNPGSEPVSVQVRAYAWATQGSEDVYTSTREIAFSPAIFRLEPGGRQLVRLLLQRPPSDRETAYRLIVDQLPPSTVSGGGLQMPVRMLLPVFAPGRDAEVVQPPRLEWEVAYNAADHTLMLTARNLGAEHVRLVDLGCVIDGKLHPVRNGLAGYALAGQTRSWVIPAAAPPRQVSVQAQGDRGPVRSDVIVAR